MAAPRFVVVLGPARSGTRLLRDMIASHPQVAAVPFDVNHVWRGGNESHRDDALPADAATPQIAERIRGRLEAFGMRAAGRDRWPNVRFVVEKTVGNALRPEFVDTVLPGAVYVRTVRDPCETIASMIEEWHARPDFAHLARKARYFGPSDLAYAAWYATNAIGGRLGHGRGLRVWGVRYPGIERDLEHEALATVCARQWLESVAATDEFFARLEPGRGISASYEELVAGPEPLARIWRFLGIEDDALAETVQKAMVRPAARQQAALPAGLNGATRRAVEERMAAYGYV